MRPFYARLGRAALWLLPGLFLLVFFILPLLSVFGATGEDMLAGGLTWEALRRAVRPLGFTFYQAALSTLATLAIGLPAAYVFGRFDFPGKRRLRTLVSLPFILPTVVAAAGFNALMGPRGWVNLGLMSLLGLDQPPILFLNTLGAVVLAHVFYNTTIILRVVGGTWERLDTRVEQAARVLGASPWRSLWEVTLPLLRPAIFSATLLVFLFDFTSFGVILLLGGPGFATLEVEIYIQALHMLNLSQAGLLSAVQMICTLAATLIYLRLESRRSVPLAPRTRGEGLRRPKSWRERLLVAGVCAALALLVAAPLGALALRSVSRLEAERGQRGEVQTGLTVDYYRELFINRRGSFFYVPPVMAARNSLLYALVTTGMSLAFGGLAAYALARRGVGARVMDALLMLPLGTSAVTLGLGYLLTFNRPPLDARSFPLLIPIAHSLVALPFVVRTLLPALRSIPPSLRQAAAVLGASPGRVWWEVDWPVLGRAALVSAVFAFTISMGEFGATTFLANPEFPTLPVAIFRFLSQPGATNYGQAMAMATLLLLVCAAGVLLLERFQEGKEW